MPDLRERFRAAGEIPAPDLWKDVQRRLATGFGQHYNKFVASIASGNVNFARMQNENLGEAAERTAANEMAVLVIDFLQVIHIQQNDGEGQVRPAVAPDFRINGFKEPAIVCQAGERIAASQLTNMILGPSVLSDFRREDHGGECGNSHKRQKQKQRSILRGPYERTVTVDSSPS